MSTESGDGFLWRWWKQPKRESGERLTPRGLPILKGSEFGAPSDGKCYLYLIPSYAWERILDFMTLDEVVRLWLTGGRQLLQALGPSGGMRRFVMDVKFPFVVDRLPLSILAKLRGLSELNVTILNDPIPRPHRRITIDTLKLLSTSITSLILDFNECMHDAHVPHLPPYLTRLVLPKNRSLSFHGISKLPATIETLDLSVNSHVTLENLPPKIADLKAPLVITPGAILPQTLTILHITTDGLVFDLNKDCLQLPEGLLVLALPPSAAQLLPDWTLTSTDFLPQLLVELDFSSVCFHSEAIFDALPTSLKVLKLGWDLQRPPRFTDAIAAKLPRDLLTFSIMPYVPITNEILDARPDCSPMTFRLLEDLPDLLTLHIWILLAGPGPADVQFRKLPTSLTDLDIRIGMLGRPTLKTLPPNLTKINIRSSSSWLFPQYTADELPNVDKLQFGETGSPNFGWTLVVAGRRGPSFRNTLKWPSRLVALRANVPAKHIAELPQTLTHLELYGKVTDQSIRDLPDGLKIFIAECCSDLTDDCIPALPHELEEISFAENRRISCRDWQFPSSLRKLRIAGSRNFCFANLPRHLTHFNSSNSTISDADIGDMPRSLTHLRLSETPLITGACLKYLNPNMVHLSITYADFTNKDIINLPRFLQTFSAELGCGELTASCCADFPPLLKVLKFPGEFITDDGIKDLPRTLKELRLPNACLLTSQALHYMPPRLQTLSIALRWARKTSFISEDEVRRVLPYVRLAHA